MTNLKDNGTTLTRRKFGTILFSDPVVVTDQDDNFDCHRSSNASDPSPQIYSTMFTPSPNSGSASPYYFMSPWNQNSPLSKSPWMQHEAIIPNDNRFGLVGSLVREEGHIYSLAAYGDLLFTGSESKNIRVWKNLQEFSGFKSNSGLVKAIVVSEDKVFTGHQDGKIRVWRHSGKKQAAYRRVGSLPTTKDYVKTSINPKNYVEVRRHHVKPWIKHFDAVSCMSVDVDQGLLYSGSWDRTLKVWRLRDSKCLESVSAHDDALNSVAVGFDGLIFTGSADGTVKVWRRELVGKHSQHILVQTLLKLDYAMTSLAVNAAAAAVYAGSSDGLVNFWEREKHFISHGGVLRGHKLAVLCLAAGGNLVLSGSADKSICLWRREEGGLHSCLSVLTGHTGPIKCLAMEEEEEDNNNDNENDQGDDKIDQRWIVYSGSLDKSVKVWRVSEYAAQLHGMERVDPTHHRLW